MTSKRLWAAVALVVLVAILVVWPTEAALAQGKGGAGAGAGGGKGGAGGDDYMERKGIEGLFAKKGGNDPRAPKTWQKTLGFGSIVVLILAIKYL